MSEAKSTSAIPDLNWDGWYWRGQYSLPCLSANRKTSLIVRTNSSDAGERTQTSKAPAPTPEQVHAYELLVDRSSPALKALLDCMRTNLPQLRDADWNEIWDELELADIIIYAASLERVAYTGFAFNGMSYEHGVNVVLHGTRMVYFGIDDISDEGAAQKDLRRQKRIKQSK